MEQKFKNDLKNELYFQDKYNNDFKKIERLLLTETKRITNQFNEFSEMYRKSREEPIAADYKKLDYFNAYIGHILRLGNKYLKKIDDEGADLIKRFVYHIYDRVKELRKAFKNNDHSKQILVKTKNLPPYSKEFYGEGILKTLSLKAFKTLANLYRKSVKGSRPLEDGELHFLAGNFIGPGTKIEKYRNVKPLNRPDAVAKQHDIDYYEAVQKFKKGDITNKERKELIRLADNKMIRALKEMGKLEGIEERYRQAGLRGIQFKRKVENVSPSLAKQLLPADLVGKKRKQKGKGEQRGGMDEIRESNILPDAPTTRFFTGRTGPITRGERKAEDATRRVMDSRNMRDTIGSFAPMVQLIREADERRAQMNELDREIEQLEDDLARNRNRLLNQDRRSEVDRMNARLGRLIRRRQQREAQNPIQPRRLFFGDGEGSTLNNRIVSNRRRFEY